MGFEWTIGRRLAASTAISCAGLGAVLLIASMTNRNIERVSQKILTVNLPSIGHISGLRARSKQLTVEFQKLALFRDQPEVFKSALEQYVKNRDRYSEIEKEYLDGIKGITIPDEAAQFAEVHTAGLKVIASGDQIWKLAQSTDSLQRAEIVNLIGGEFDKLASAHQKKLKAFDDFHVELGETWSKELVDIQKRDHAILLYSSILIMLIAAGFGWDLARRIGKGLTSIAHGLSSSVSEVEAASDSLLTISSTLSTSVTQQASSVSQTTASAEQVSATITQNNIRSDQTLVKAREAQKASANSCEIVAQLKIAMQGMELANRDMATLLRKNTTEIGELVSLIKGIGERTKVINDIVFQTKLLSFNASVEAARAGEAGRGFAVVAEEVGNLAAMSGQAATTISELLSQSSARAESIVQSSKSSVEVMVRQGEERSEDARRVADGFQSSLNEITSHVGEMLDRVQNISSASNEQSKNMSAISRAMGEIDKSTRGNQGLSQNCSEAAQSLRSQCETSTSANRKLLRMVFGEKFSKSA